MKRGNALRILRQTTLALVALAAIGILALFGGAIVDVFTDAEIALCREKLWNENLFKRTWDHFSAKLDDAA